jgi:hypothetical protein
MKTKGKKADKKKPLPSTKDDKPIVIEASAAINATEAPERAEDIVPIEVLQEDPAPVTATVETRRAITNEERQRLISQAAYYRAQRVGFGKTNPVDDWLLAEREVDAMMAGGKSI